MDATPEAALLYLATHPDSTTSDIGKELFDPDDDRELRNADRRVRYWLTEKFPHLVEASEDDSPTTYAVRSDRVYAGMGRVEVETFGGESLSIGLGATLVHIDEDDQINVETSGEIRADEPIDVPTTGDD